MVNNMRVIGLTGGSGAGKGEVSLCFMSHGIKCLDTDKVSREVCAPGMPCLSELVEYFGEGILTEDGKLNRRGLFNLVFGEPDPESRDIKISALNRITHKHIVEEIHTWLRAREAEGDGFAVVDAPQLFESGFDRHCDYIVGVIADDDVRIRRIISRDKITLDTAKKRIASQKSNDFFAKNCDFTVHNNSGLEIIEGQVNSILEKINFFS